MAKTKARLKRELKAKNAELAALASSMDSTGQLSPSGGWYNPNNSFGPETDPNFNTIYLPPYEFTYLELTHLYQNALIRRVIHLHMDDGTKNGLELVSKEKTDAAQDIESEMDERFQWVSLTRKMVGIKHNYGGGVLYADIDDGGDPQDPLNEGRVRRVNSFWPVERYFAHPITSYPLFGEEKPGQPMHYKITIQGFKEAQSFTCHESRLIRFPAYHSDDVLSLRDRTRRITWPSSTVQIIYDAVKGYQVGLQSQSQLFQRFVMDVFKIADMRKITDLEKTREYVQNQMLLRNSMNAIIVDADGDISSQAVPTTGIGEMTNSQMQNVSMATGIGMSILFSNESGSLGGSSTGEDRKTWYSKKIADQNNEQTPLVRQMVRLVSLERGKKWPIDDIQYKWGSPYDHTPIEQAELENKTAETDKIYVESLGASESEVLNARWGSGQFSQATPDFDKEEFEEELEEMEVSEQEAAEADREMQKSIAEKTVEETPEEPEKEETSQDEKSFKLRIE